MVLTDTHAHLYVRQFNDDRPAMIQRAIDASVSRLFLPNIDHTSIDGMLQLCKDYPDNCFPMMGIHPCSVKDNYKELLDIAKSHLFSENHPYVAVGEIGIDLHWDKTTLDKQISAFKTQIEWAKTLGLPIIIHARESFDEIFEVVDELNDDSLRGIFHCFTGSIEQAKKIINYGGFMMGLGGVLTFKKAGLDEVVKDIPMEYLVLETDSPYLTPAPYRGKRNESSYVTHIAQRLAEVKGLTIEEVANITTENSKRMFGI